MLRVGVIGPGRVGSALLEQLRAAQPRLLRDNGLELRLCGVVASKRMWLDCDDAELNGRHGGAQIWRPNDLDAFAEHVRGNDSRHALLIDCSANDDVAAHYPRWLAAGMHVVTPNKLAGSGPLPRWQAIRAACASGARFRYEATVCAGLPVVQTLRDLLDTGDELLAVEGMFSGTLAWLCNRHDGQQPFSELVREAHALGYTEPDPRDDLSGMDVARKLVILAREAGWPLSLEDVAVESLVPRALAALPLEDCLQRLHELDALMSIRLAEATTAGGVLRYVASLDRHGRARVKLVVLPAKHPFAHTRLTDNIVQFTTRRYCDNPLSVQGPGAGPEVTAAGVFTDLLRIAESLEVRA
jgi:homoserine dehydrogenase